MAAKTKLQKAQDEIIELKSKLSSLEKQHSVLKDNRLGDQKSIEKLFKELESVTTTLRRYESKLSDIHQLSDIALIKVALSNNVYKTILTDIENQSHDGRTVMVS